MKKTNTSTITIKRRRKSYARQSLGLPYGIFMAIFIVLPILILLIYAFSDTDNYGRLVFNFTFENFAVALSPTNLKVIWRSIWVGLVSTLICFGIGYPTAYFLATKSINKSATLVMLFVLPMWINFLLRTLATKSLLSFLSPNGSAIFGMGTVIFGMVYNFLPFMILPIYTSIQKIDNSLLEASSDLGASSIQTFSKVVLPLSVPGIISGFTMVFTPAITTFVISDMLSNNKIMLIGNFINLQINQMNYGVGAAISFIVLLFIGLTMIFVRKYDKTNSVSGGGLW